MDFIKKNYEKVVLGLVLAGLMGVLVYMLLYIASDKEGMEERSNKVLNPSVKPLPALDLTTNNEAITLMQSPYRLDFESGNKIFNPREWQRGVGGELILTATGIGPRAVAITNISALYFVLTLDSVITNELGARYVLGVQRQADKNPTKRTKQQRYASSGDKPNDTFEIVEVKGPADNPAALVLRLVDSGETVSISREKSFRRVDGYTVDFRYDPEKKTFKLRRKDDKVSFGGIDYVIVEITQNELVIADQSNQKKTSLPFVP